MPASNRATIDDATPDSLLCRGVGIMVLNVAYFHTLHAFIVLSTSVISL
jgi:hypothetical protein